MSHSTAAAYLERWGNGGMGRDPLFEGRTPCASYRDFHDERLQTWQYPEGSVDLDVLDLGRFATDLVLNSRHEGEVDAARVEGGVGVGGVDVFGTGAPRFEDQGYTGVHFEHT